VCLQLPRVVERSFAPLWGRIPLAAALDHVRLRSFLSSQLTRGKTKNRFCSTKALRDTFCSNKFFARGHTQFALSGD